MPEASNASIVVDTIKWAGQIITAGKPVANIPGKMCNAVPSVSDWTNLTETTGPQSINWTLHRVNAYNISVAKIEFELKWDYGARYHNGGAFIPNCWLLIRSCEVKWGYSVDLNFSAQTPTNANPEDQGPLARLPVTITGTVSNIIQTSVVGWSFVLFGDGSSTIL